MKTFYVLFLFFAANHTFASSDFKDLLQSINSSTTANYTHQYQPSYRVQILNSQYTKFNDIAYLLNTRHGNPDNHLVEINTQTGDLFINKQTYNANQHNLDAIFSSKAFLSINKKNGDEILEVFSHQYQVRFNLLNDATISKRLESKSNTCQAMLDLKQTYQDDPKMSYYLNLYFPNTGFVKSADHLKVLMHEYKQKGIVFKLDEGSGTNNVFVASQPILEKLLTHSEPLNIISDRLTDIKDIAELNQAIEKKELIWQEYFDIDFNELNFLLFKNNEKLYKIGTVAFCLYHNNHSHGSYYTTANKKQIFSHIAPDAFDYFERIAHLLFERKIKLAFQSEPHVNLSAINLKIIGFDLLPIVENGKLIPKISEINPRMTGESHVIQGFFAQPKSTFSHGKIYLSLTTDNIPLDPEISAADFHEKFNRAFDEAFSEHSPEISVELTRLLIQQPFNAFETYISFYPLERAQQQEAVQRMQTFINALWQAFSLEPEKLSDERQIQ